MSCCEHGVTYWTIAGYETPKKQSVTSRLGASPGFFANEQEPWLAPKRLVNNPR
jgi:hypothetical protein